MNNAYLRGYMQGYMSKEALDLDIKEGDILLGGRFKNKRTVVKELGTDELGQPTVNGKKLLNFRIEKKLPDSKKSRQTLEKDAAETPEQARQRRIKALIAQSWTPIEAQEIIDIEDGKISEADAQVVSTGANYKRDVTRNTPYIQGDKSKMTPKQKANSGAIFHRGVKHLEKMRKKK